MDSVIVIPREIWLAFWLITDAALRLIEEQEPLPLPEDGYMVALPGQRMEVLRQALEDLARLAEKDSEAC